MLPYDGSPGGNALGAMYDDRSRRINQEMFEAHFKEPSSAPQSRLQLVASLSAAAIIIFVMLYGTVG